ncbi:hypothetical protein EON64_05470 [archaeon]|nr:MAG: hypothetical protein EON64_05470 [archaeon]
MQTSKKATLPSSSCCRPPARGSSRTSSHARSRIRGTSSRQDLKFFSVWPRRRATVYAGELPLPAQNRGAASVTDAGQGFLQGLTAVTTDQRWAGRA